MCNHLPWRPGLAMPRGIMPRHSHVRGIIEQHLRPHFARHRVSRVVIENMEAFAIWRPRRPNRGTDDRDVLPVKPDRPSNLSGGAAVELNFDE